jgi:hypothetical protein
METVCHNQLRFESLFSKEVIGDFAGGRITSDAGSLVLRELDQRYRLAENAARCLHDPREGHKVKHDLLTLVRQRLFAIAQGYEDNNDAATLAKDPAFKIMADRLSCHRFLANQFRLLLHTVAYCLFWLLRHHLQGTELATAQVNTLRLKLLKIGARIRETSRRIWVHLASGYPYRDLLAGLLQNLRASLA